MLLLDDILMLPFKAPVAGVRWVLKQIQTMAENELNNDQVWKERLIELQMKLELGEITEEDFAAEEKEIFQRLREIRLRQQEQARQYEEEEDEVTIHTGYGESSDKE